MSTHIPRRTTAPRDRRGAVIVLAAFLMVFMVGMLAMTIDLGMISSTRTDAQRAADAGAMAAAGALIDGTAAATAKANELIALNPVGGRTLTTNNVTVEYGVWDSNARTFTVNNNSPSAVRVTVNALNNSMFFGKALGKSTFDTQGQAIAVYQPRDIQLCLDYSGSMNDDSRFVAFNKPGLSQAAVEANLLQIYQQLGSPTFGNMTWNPVYISSNNNTTVKNTLGIRYVPYPYPGGSWDEYIDYMQSSSEEPAGVGYRKDYGYLTFMNYLLDKRNGNSSTPALKNCSEQPLTCLKDAVDEFIAYLQLHETDDRVGFTLYTGADNTSTLEATLTSNLSSIATLVRARQAGHYVGGTNISAGMNKARIDLQNNARVGALKMIVLMTDGQANMPSNSTTAKAAVVTEANACAAAKIPVVCIALGAGADTALMQQVASITGGVAFIIPGGQSIAQVKTQLEDIFKQVAADRPLKLVY